MTVGKKTEIDGFSFQII